MYHLVVVIGCCATTQSLGNVQIWTRPISPQGSWAFVLLNTGTAVPAKVSLKVSDLGLVNQSGYNITEVFDGIVIGLKKPSDTLKLSVNPSGVFFAKATKLS